YRKLLGVYADDEAAKAKVKDLEAALALDKSLREDFEKLLVQSDFAKAFERLRAAEKQGVAPAKTAGLHLRVRDAWPAAATTKPTDEAQRDELLALLKVYPDDLNAKNLADSLTKKLGSRELDLG